MCSITEYGEKRLAFYVLVREKDNDRCRLTQKKKLADMRLKKEKLFRGWLYFGKDFHLLLQGLVWVSSGDYLHAENHRASPPQCWVYRQAVIGPDTHAHQYTEVHVNAQDSNTYWDSSIRGTWVGPSPPPAQRNKWE